MPQLPPIQIQYLQTDKVTVVELTIGEAKYKGEAVRHKDDTPDRTTGIALATSRALESASKDFNRVAWSRISQQDNDRKQRAKPKPKRRFKWTGRGYNR